MIIISYDPATPFKTEKSNCSAKSQSFRSWSDFPFTVTDHRTLQDEEPLKVSKRTIGRSLPRTMFLELSSRASRTWILRGLAENASQTTPQPIGVDNYDVQPQEVCSSKEPIKQVLFYEA